MSVGNSPPSVPLPRVPTDSPVSGGRLEDGELELDWDEEEGMEENQEVEGTDEEERRTSKKVLRVEVERLKRGPTRTK